jgi:hypothetical protein
MAATITKADVVLFDSVSNAAGATTTSSWADLSLIDFPALCITNTNGASGPTVPAQYQMLASKAANGSPSVPVGGPLVSLTGNIVSTSWGDIVISAGCRYFALQVTANTGQAVTAYAYLGTYKKV